jgi:hypothetical protein
MNIAWAISVFQPGDQYNWLRYMRLNGQDVNSHYFYNHGHFIVQLALEWLPMTLMLPFIWRRWRQGMGLFTLPIVAPLLCYIVTGLALLFLWPGTGTRYAMPLTPALAVLAAFAVEELWRRRHWLARVATGMLGLLALYQLLLIWIGIPVLADQFGLSRGTGKIIERVIRADPAPVYCASPCDPTRLLYIDLPIESLPVKQFDHLKPPAWLLTTRDFFPLYAHRRPDIEARVVVDRPEDPRILAVKLLAKPPTP